MNNYYNTGLRIRVRVPVEGAGFRYCVWQLAHRLGFVATPVLWKSMIQIKDNAITRYQAVYHA